MNQVKLTASLAPPFGRTLWFACAEVWSRPTPPPDRFLALGGWVLALWGLLRRVNQPDLRLAAEKLEGKKNQCCLTKDGVMRDVFTE